MHSLPCPAKLGKLSVVSGCGCQHTFSSFLKKLSQLFGQPMTTTSCPWYLCYVLYLSSSLSAPSVEVSSLHSWLLVLAFISFICIALEEANGKEMSLILGSRIYFSSVQSQSLRFWRCRTFAKQTLPEARRRFLRVKEGLPLPSFTSLRNGPAIRL